MWYRSIRYTVYRPANMTEMATTMLISNSEIKTVTMVPFAYTKDEMAESNSMSDLTTCNGYTI